MAGHSKWNNIKQKKGKTDAARGKIFTKLGRELAVSIKEGGPDPTSNSKLRDVIAKCKVNNMPNETIDKAIKKATGDANNINYEEIMYEGYGINGVAIIVNVTTDNRNRTAGEVRHAFSKQGGNLGATGSVSYMFDKKGIIIVEKVKATLSEDDLMLLVLDSGAEDFITEEEYYEIITSPEDFSNIRNILEENKIEMIESEIKMVPQTYISLSEEQYEKQSKMIELLEELDDVIEVFHNFEE